MISVEAVGSIVRIEVAGCKVDLTIGDASHLCRLIGEAIDRAVDARVAARFAAAETPTTDAPSLGIDAGSGGMSPGSPSGHVPSPDGPGTVGDDPRARKALGSGVCPKVGGLR